MNSVVHRMMSLCVMIAALMFCCTAQAFAATQDHEPLSAGASSELTTAQALYVPGVTVQRGCLTLPLHQCLVFSRAQTAEIADVPPAQAASIIARGCRTLPGPQVVPCVAIAGTLVGAMKFTAGNARKAGMCVAIVAVFPGAAPDIHTCVE